MRRKFVCVVAALLIGVGSLVSGTGIDHASANSQLQGELNRIQEERKEKQNKAEKTETEIKEIESQIRTVEEEMKVIDQETAETNQNIRDKESEIGDTRARIEKLHAELLILEERIAERDELLKDRVRLMYQNGGAVSYLEVILGAQSFGDFLDRISALSTIAQQDRSILEAHIEDKRLVEEMKLLLEEELAALETQLQELEQLRAKLEEQRKQKDKLMSELERKEDELHTDLGELEDSDKILASQEQAIKQELAAWQERERQRKEQERLRQQQQGTSAQTGAKPTVTAEGTFMRPATGRITSGHGMRWGKMHHGIDIGKNGRTGDVPIVAAESGTVIRSYYSSSYGNTVMISHNVNGKVITTLYAHLENRFVSDGERVEKGQTLGYMGNTGRSFGAHLHFEVHEGPWNANKSNSVNPLNYIPN
ncbi:murein hydrolase activator EnvC family protein [Anaerobacillus sp. MEB173]|uniref:murein hydrolase activator EnvC family protein n=1 Tax=Anaerobacillus sp. MEB173 TaxID=3383345 RepID=UPI003F8DCE02